MVLFYNINEPSDVTAAGFVRGMLGKRITIWFEQPGTPDFTRIDAGTLESISIDSEGFSYHLQGDPERVIVPYGKFRVSLEADIVKRASVIDKLDAGF